MFSLAQKCRALELLCKVTKVLGLVQRTSTFVWALGANSQMRLANFAQSWTYRRYDITASVIAFLGDVSVDRSLGSRCFRYESLATNNKLVLLVHRNLRIRSPSSIVPSQSYELLACALDDVCTFGRSSIDNHDHFRPRVPHRAHCLSAYLVTRQLAECVCGEGERVFGRRFGEGCCYLILYVWCAERGLQQFPAQRKRSKELRRYCLQ